jgi:hypothetical protein
MGDLGQNVPSLSHHLPQNIRPDLPPQGPAQGQQAPLYGIPVGGDRFRGLLPDGAKSYAKG